MSGAVKKGLGIAVLAGAALLFGCQEQPLDRPLANIVAIPTQGTVPLIVHFDGSGSTDPAGPVTDWLWDFGDGSGVVSGREVDHTYEKSGEHIVTLVVVGPSGTGRATTVIRALNNPPVAAFTYYPNDPFEGEVVTFESLSLDPDGRIVDWHWDFGDGATGRGEYVDHAFSTPGSYVVTLTVVDNANAIARTSQTVRVEECSGGYCGRR